MKDTLCEEDFKDFENLIKWANEQINAIDLASAKQLIAQSKRIDAAKRNKLENEI